MLTKHDTEVARLIGGYPEVRADNCTWCEGPLELPSAETVVSERTLILDGVRIRPDITALDANNEPVALVEVIDTHPLRPDAMSAVLKTSIPTFLVSIQKQKPRAVYCSTFCWVHRDEERLSGLESCAGCDTLDFTNGSYRDWDGDPHYAFCLECAAGFSDAQWKSPGSLIGGDPSAFGCDHSREVPSFQQHGILGYGLGRTSEVPFSAVHSAARRECHSKATGPS